MPRDLRLSIPALPALALLLFLPGARPAFSQSDLSITKVDGSDPVFLSGLETYTLTVVNDGPAAAQDVTLTDELPPGTTFQGLTAPAGWSCTTPAVDAGGTVSCSMASVDPGTFVFSLTVEVGTGFAVPGELSNTATWTTTTVDPSPGMESSTATTTLQTPPAVTARKSASGTFVAGGTITYIVVLTNTGSVDQPDNPGDELTDVLPAQLVLIEAFADNGTVAANVGTNTVTWNGAVPGGGEVTISIQATIAPGTAGQAVSNQATFVFDADANGSNESAGMTEDTVTGGPTVFTVGQDPVLVSEVPTLGEWGLILLALALGLLGAAQMRRRARI